MMASAISPASAAKTASAAACGRMARSAAAWPVARLMTSAFPTR